MLLFRRFVARGPAFRAAAPGPTLLTVSPCYFSRTERDLAVFSKFRWSITTYLHAGHGSPRNPRLHTYYSSTVAAMTDAVANVIAEGSARIKLPEGVFYNRVQEFNRDLTVAVLQWFQKVHKKEWLMKNEKRLNSPSRLSQSQYSGLRILEALGGSGIRSVRFALEVPNIGEIVCNDLDERAVEMIHQNVLLNGVNKFVKVSNLDAVNLMHVYKEFSSRFNVVDIDPFGSASPFLDGAVQCLHSGGLLCVTATDMAVMCGSTPGTSMGKYGGMAVKNSAQQETGLRILLHAIQSAASRHGMVIEPLLTLSIDFYARVFVRVWASQIAVKSVSTKHAICFTCTGCTAYHIQPLGRLVLPKQRVCPSFGPSASALCSECGSPFHMWGPIWCGPLHSRPFLRSFLSAMGAPTKLSEPESVSFQAELATLAPGKYGAFAFDGTKSLYSDTDLCQPLPEVSSCGPELTDPVLKERVSERFGTYKRIIGVCTMAYEELEDVVLYYKTDQLAAVLGMKVPPLLELYSAFLNAGYRISASHAERSSFKTNAPMSFIWDVFRTFRQRLQNAEKISSDSSDNDTASDTCVENGSAVAPLEKDSPMKRRRLKRRNSSTDGTDLVTLRGRVRTALLAQPISGTVDFSIHPDANPPSRVDKLVRFQLNPEKFWGPKARPKYMKSSVSTN